MDNWAVTDITKVLAETDPTKPNDHLDLVISDALKNLTFEDREHITHEIHGITDDIEENPNFVKSKLNEFQHCLDMILGRRREMATTYYQQQQPSSSSSSLQLPIAAYELAESLDPAYVNNVDLRLNFLRCDGFNAQLAAERYVKYFDFKYEFFGQDKLCKTIGYDDLDEDDKYVLENKGFMQLLPERDRAGRPIAIFFPSQQDYRKGCDVARVYGRVHWFLMSMLTDPISTRKGYVLIIYNVGKLNVQNLYHEIPPAFWRAQQSCPINIVSIHICFSNVLFRIVIQNLLKLLGNRLQVRGKVHQGTQQEVNYQLMTYGIPVDLLPANSNGQITTRNHLEMISMAKTREEYMKNSSNLEYYVIPYINDVTFGRGEPNQSRPGNIRLKLIVEELLPEYNSLQSNQSKMEMQTHVVKTVHSSGGRFLSKEAGVWMEVPLDAAKKKVATLFRNRRKAQVKNERRKSSSSSPPSSRAEEIPYPLRCEEEEQQQPSFDVSLSSSCAGSKRVRT